MLQHFSFTVLSLQKKEIMSKDSKDTFSGKYGSMEWQEQGNNCTFVFIPWVAMFLSLCQNLPTSGS